MMCATAVGLLSQRYSLRYLFEGLCGCCFYWSSWTYIPRCFRSVVLNGEPVIKVEFYERL